MSPTRANLALAAGALIGLALAGFGVLETRPATSRAVPADAVALVGGRPIARAHYQSALSALATDRRDKRLDESIRRHALERLIDDELLVQRGIELGLAARDPRVRADLGTAVIDQLTAQARAKEPDEDTLRAFYRDNRSFFARPPRVRVQQLWFTDRHRAEQARQDWQAGRPVTVHTRADSKPATAPTPVPDRLLPAPKLRDYIGATATRFALGAEIGAISDVLPAVGGYRVLRVRERRASQERALDDIRDLVRAEYMRRAGERRVQQFLRERRASTEIVIAEDLL